MADENAFSTTAKYGEQHGEKQPYFTYKIIGLKLATDPEVTVGSPLKTSSSAQLC